MENVFCMNRKLLFGEYFSSKNISISKKNRSKHPMKRNFTVGTPPSVSAPKLPVAKNENLFDGLSPPTSPVREIASPGTCSINSKTSKIENADATSSPNTVPVRLHDRKLTQKKSVDRVISDSPRSSFSSGESSPETNVKNQLSLKGYNTKDTIITENTSGERAARYLKVVNNKGQTIYVDPTDVDGWVEVADIVVNETTKPSKIPGSIRQGTYELVSKYAYGVAFESDGELCTIINDGKNNPLETVFRTMGDDDNTPYGKSVSYPIFKMGDILANNERVSQKIKSVIAVVRNAELRFCKEQAERSSMEAEKLKLLLNNIERLIPSYSLQLGDTIQLLEDYQERWALEDQNDDEVKEKSRLVSLNLEKNHNMFVSVISACSDLSIYGDQIREITEKVSNIEKYIKDSSADARKLYTE